MASNAKKKKNVIKFLITYR